MTDLEFPRAILLEIDVDLEWCELSAAEIVAYKAGAKAATDRAVALLHKLKMFESRLVTKDEDPKGPFKRYTLVAKEKRMTIEGKKSQG